jgi:TolB-like protein/cytochrome c-type biogenesis protein CcmH/NrfG
MADATPPTASRAVFLSYSRDDAEAARRIADALRAFGMEVWFDQNELRGGDSWDAKIKRQIRECALFLPVISQHTQARVEGYFRREWKLGVERTHDMAGGVAFIAPVVIDDTLESAALVPEEFMRYQWTRLPHGVPSPEFVTQVKRLLESPQLENPARAARKATGPLEASSPRGMPGWAWGVVGALLVAAAALVLSRRPAPPAALPAPAAEAKPASAAAVPSDKSVAVLPFDNMSEEKDANAFFADGVQEDILTDLSFIKDLRVVSRTSVMQYRGTVKPIGQIARELGVTYVLEGSVRRAGNKVRVTGQLIHAATDEHVWAKAYDRDISDVFAIQSELSQDIADALQAAISPAEHSLIVAKPTTNAAAYALYVKARTADEDATTNPATECAWLLNAVQLDPNFAQAWALLAAREANQHFSETDQSAGILEKAKAAIDTAVRLAPDDPVVIEMQGDYYYYAFRDYKAAAERYVHLQSLKPNSSDGYGSLALIYRRQGRWADAEANFRKSVELDPRNMRYRVSFADFLLRGHRYDEALSEMRQVAAIAPDNISWGFYMAMIPFLKSGSTVEGDALIAHLTADKPNDPMSMPIRKGWARERSDFAEAVRLDELQPYDDATGSPHWSQDLQVALDYIANSDEKTGKEKLAKLLPEVKALVADQPNNGSLWSVIGLAEAILGQRADALEAANKLVAITPESVDAVDGPQKSQTRAVILAWVGEKDQALAELSRLAHTPFSDVDVMADRNNVGWLPLRDDPRFKAIMDDPRNTAPLF